MSGVIRWEEPPASRSNVVGKASKWRQVAAELRSRPGEWAAVETKQDAHSAAQTAMCIRSGVYAGMPKGEFEAVARKVDGEARVYARYVGTGDRRV